MFFITQRKRRTTLLGIFNHRLFAFGKQGKYLVIYEKDCFNAGDWTTFVRTDFECKSNGCLCLGGIAVAAGIVDGKIWTIGKGLVWAGVYL